MSPAGGGARTVAADAPAARRLRVLVVDDVPALRTLCARQLRHAGHHVVGEVGTVADALAAAAALAPDVIVLDVHLPDGLGTDALPVLIGRGVDGRANGHADGPRRLGVVLYTGDVRGVDGAAAVRAGAFAVLEKPAPAPCLDAAVRGAASA